MPLTSQTKNRILEGLVGNDNLFGGSIYVGLSSTAPNSDGTNITEPPSNEETGYKRVLIGSSSTLTQKFGDPENFVITNKEEIYFPESKGSWGTLTHFVLYNSATGTSASNILAFEELKDGGVASPITVSGEKVVVMFRPGKLTVTLSN
jgi:hypothetical protein